MAAIRFLYRSNRTNAPLTARLQYSNHGNKVLYDGKTNVVVAKSDFTLLKSKSSDITKRNKRREIEELIYPLEKFIIDKFHKTQIADIDKKWLEKIIHQYHHPPEAKSDLMTYWIQHIINQAPIRDNSKGGKGLTKSRVYAWKNLLGLFTEFSNGFEYTAQEVNEPLAKQFLDYLVNTKKHSTIYATKLISDLKTALKEAKANGIAVSPDLDKIKARKGKVYDDDMDVIYLNEQEIQAIQNAELKREALINARKWLILLCYTGQRGDTLTSRLTNDSFKKRGNAFIIELRQKKTNKTVIIPVLPPVQKIYDEGLPYKVSTQKLNGYLKKVGEKAKINTPTIGKLIEKTPNGMRKIKKERPKWMYMATHIGRRSFATNHYKKLPTPIIMGVTGHSKESTFLAYINKSDETHVDAFIEYYTKKEAKQNGTGELSVLKNAVNQ
jgi:integrase